MTTRGTRATLTEETAQAKRPNHYRQGYEAGSSGAASADCPYATTRGGYRSAWLFGWARGASDRARGASASRASEDVETR